MRHTRRRMTAPTGRDLVDAQVAIESFGLSADGTTIVYAYDNAGNRTTVTVTCGTGGC